MDIYEFRQVFLPYCLKKLADGRYIVLNRRYKPLGIAASEWVVYEDHPSATVINGIGPATARKLSAREDESVELIQLYHDGCLPTDGGKHWEAYAKRLALLSRLDVEVPRIARSTSS